MPETADRLLALTTQITAAYLGANAANLVEVPVLIRSIYRSLADLDTRHAGHRTEPVAAAPEARSTARPAVEIRKSVFADHLICLEEGLKMTMLKRHLRTAHGLTPEQYRAKWDLPASYPMAAPAYAKTRSVMAKARGLGRT